MTQEELLAKLQGHFAANAQFKINYSEITMELAAADLTSCCNLLRTAANLQFDQLMDLCVVDYLTYGIGEWETNSATIKGFSRGVEAAAFEKSLQHNLQHDSHRFAVIYHLLSTVYNCRLRLKVLLPNDALHVPTVMNIWASANWYEREAFDLFGVIFDGHPDLRRILTDYGFIGHPFRKDFPLIGQVEMRYDAAAARVVYEPVSIAPRTLVPKVIRYTASSTQEEIS